MKNKLFITALFVAASFLAANAQYTKLIDFSLPSEGYPTGSLISDGTFLYGMTGGVVIFKIKPDGTGYAKLLDFDNANVGAPTGSLISDGTFLYGMTLGGGTNDLGVIFKIQPDGTGFAKLLDFTDTNGGEPYGSLISDGIFLYGMTYGGGTNNLGVIFKIKPDGTGYSKLLDFSAVANGRYPRESLISDGTFLYGMTSQGGTNDMGVIFKIKPDGTGFAKLLDFTGAANGSEPHGSLISDGTFLYGMTRAGGTNDIGVVFKIKPDGTGFAKLLDFTGAANGSQPFGSLIYDGTFLYGMTKGGGTNGYGVIFKYALATGIAEHPAKGGFNVYPNPSSGKFAIEMNGSQGAKSEAQIYNMLGEKVYETTISEPSSTISLNVPGGVYFIHITTEQGTASRKIVVSQ